MKKGARGQAAFLAFFLFFAGVSNALAGPGAKVYYVFASSNRTPGLADETALQKLDSFEEANAIAVADRVGCALARRVEVSGLVGVYEQSSENSFLVKADLSAEQMGYFGSLIGSYERQRYILAFSPERGGKDRLWILRTSRSFASVASMVREEHMTPLSIRVEKGAVQVWIVDLGDKLGQQPKNLSVELEGRISSQDGTAEILGSEEDLSAAEAAYRKKIQSFEQGSKLRFSVSAANGEWQKTSGRTCSGELAP